MKKTIGADELDAATLEFGLLVGLLLPEGKDPVKYKLNKDWLKDPVAQLRKQLKTVSKDLNGCLKDALNALKTGGTDKAENVAEEFSKWNPLLFPAIGFGGHVGDLGEVPAIDWLSLITNGGDVPETIENWVQKVAGDRKTLKAWGAALVGLVTGQLDHPTGTGTLDDPYLFAIMEVGSMGTLYLSLAGKEEKDGSVALVPGLSFDSDPIDLDGEN
ncbi:hypothetical protein [Pseudovibrio ascidiaceicola]|uniref:hypothetical protein n=1 Tax=Pseudovibrio ascidiaceicola TaxID=285279 RepID=UPI000D68AC96|nr:hypothetical protein [Pseudovibrio ascidiaceicola]